MIRFGRLINQLLVAAFIFAATLSNHAGHMDHTSAMSDHDLAMTDAMGLPSENNDGDNQIAGKDDCERVHTSCSLGHCCYPVPGGFISSKRLGGLFEATDMTVSLADRNRLDPPPPKLG